MSRRSTRRARRRLNRLQNRKATGSALTPQQGTNVIAPEAAAQRPRTPITSAWRWFTALSKPMQTLITIYIHWSVELVEVVYGSQKNIIVRKSIVAQTQQKVSLNPGDKTTLFITGQYSSRGPGGLPELYIGGYPVQKMEIVCSARFQNLFRWTEKRKFRLLCILENGNYQWMPYDSQHSR
jgi:hypothetical protein